MRIQEQASLQPFNTFHLEAKASTLYELESIDDLLQVLPTTSNIRILGGGSNVLLTHDVQGDVWLNRIKGIEVVEEQDDYVRVKFASGEVWHDCVRWALDHNYGGIENLSLIPGTIGAAPMQNIGAYGVELKDVFYCLEAIHLVTKERRIFSHEACAFGYRESVFKHDLKQQYFICSVTLELKKNPIIRTDYGSIQEELQRLGYQKPYSIQQVSEAVIQIRSSKLPDPNDIGNAGSFFKNPVITQDHFQTIQQQHPEIPSYPASVGVKVPAAWLIEHCGWKGFREGDYGVHAKQALVLVNYGQSNGLDIFKLSERIILSVKERFGIELQREVNIW